MASTSKPIKTKLLFVSHHGFCLSVSCLFFGALEFVLWYEIKNRFCNFQFHLIFNFVFDADKTSASELDERV